MGEKSLLLKGKIPMEDYQSYLETLTNEELINELGDGPEIIIHQDNELLF